MSVYQVNLSIMKESNGVVTPFLQIGNKEKNEGKSFLDKEYVEFSFSNDFYGLRDAIVRYIDFIKLFEIKPVNMAYLWKDGYYSKEDVKKAIDDAQMCELDEIEMEYE